MLSALTLWSSSKSLSTGSTFGSELFSTLGDLHFSSCGVIASMLYISLKGVNLMHMVIVVFSSHTTLGSWSGHLPFVSSCNLFLTAMKFFPFALSNASFDWG
jgi:hypothetical protein